MCTQKDRTEWWLMTERNTQYFHMLVNKRRLNNRILRLKMADDQWIDSVTNRIRNSGSSQWNLYQFSVEHILSQLQAIDMQCLATDQQQKVMYALSNGCFKGHWSKGIQTLFYQKYCSTINVVRICSHNATLLVLAERIQNWQVLQWQVILMLDGAGCKRNKMRAIAYVCKDRSRNKVLLGCHYWEWNTKGYCRKPFNH